MTVIGGINKRTTGAQKAAWSGSADSSEMSLRSLLKVLNNPSIFILSYELWLIRRRRIAEFILFLYVN